MAKRSKRRTSRRQRDQAGCISGIMNIFQFRQVRATKRLLPDRQHVSKQAAVGAGHSSDNNTISPSPTEICEILGDTEESENATSDANKTSTIKELMEEEMFNEKGSKQPNGSETAPKQVTPKSHILIEKKHHKKKKSSAKSSDMDFDWAHEQSQTANNLDLERILEELGNISQRLNTNCSTKHDSEHDIDEEKLIHAVKLLVEQSMSSNNCSEELVMDFLQTLSVNKGLFLKILQDRKPELLKHVQDSEEARLGKKKPVLSLKPDELSSHKNWNFFKRRTKSLEIYHMGETNMDCQTPSKIFILKPGPEWSRTPGTDITDNDNNSEVQHNEKTMHQFSFTEIKRKLRQAMGKERSSLKYLPKIQNSNFNSEKGDSYGWRSPNRNHFYTERFALSSPSFKKGEPVGIHKDDSEKSNIYIEAKKHLSEMVKSADENTISTSSNNPVKPLGSIISLPEYNDSPCLSPRKLDDDILLSDQMRLSPHCMLEDSPSQRMQNLESQPCISCSDSEVKVQSLDANYSNSHGDNQDYSLEIKCFNEDTIVSEVQSVVADMEQTNELRILEEENIINDDIREINNNKESASPSLISHLSGEEQVLSSPATSPPHNRASSEIEYSDRAMDKIEQPSPISVLEPLFPDDDMSPARTIFHPVEKEIQPRHIHFEEEPSSFNDHGICTRISLEDEESEFEYVEAVLLGSGLNWDEFLLRWVCSYEILDQSLFGEVELFSSRPLHNQKLLFDCANETLKEFCECYFGCIAKDVNLKSIRQVPEGMDLIHGVWERVERCLFQNLQFHSLEQLVKKDFAGSNKWIHSDPEIIVFDMEESIFDELVEEIVLGFGDVNV